MFIICMSTFKEFVTEKYTRDICTLRLCLELLWILSYYQPIVIIILLMLDLYICRQLLGRVWDYIETVDPLDSQDDANLALLTRPELGITFTKIRCWNLTQYTKCVFLDADTLVLQNCDELFDRRELSAVPDIGWPDCFNSGVFVFEPSRATYEALLQYAVDYGSFDGMCINVFVMYQLSKNYKKNVTIS